MPSFTRKKAIGLIFPADGGRSNSCPFMRMNTAQHSYDTLSACINDLQKRGYDTDLEVNEKGLVSRVRETPLDPGLFTIDEFYRFEGTSDPADMSIVYAISSEELGLKGLIVNAFGTYASSVVNKMVSRLDVHAQHTSSDLLTTNE